MFKLKLTYLYAVCQKIQQHPSDELFILPSDLKIFCMTWLQGTLSDLTVEHRKHDYCDLFIATNYRPRFCSQQKRVRVHSGNSMEVLQKKAAFSFLL